MNSPNLTNASIYKSKNASDITLNNFLRDLDDLKKKSPYILIIQSTAKSCTRLTIYPINQEKIIKVSICGTGISDTLIEDLSNTLKDFDLIHTSGLLIKGKELNFECYLNLSLSDTKSKDLKNSLNKIRNIFKVINIEEIGLKKRKLEKE